ncbi:unnamed protein product [Rangifer tarandus platyrhynchus]|uniref:Uncharacterized protein n=2 Tax=Rangifer tarandus platyrhynchus TaxID=3082113 RepID=A0AC59ZDH5_RANTA|nr:unnamed protein product [Rangifer tarandus platyrhynchus]
MKPLSRGWLLSHLPRACVCEPVVCWRQRPEPGPPNSSSPATWPGLRHQYRSMRDGPLPGLLAPKPGGCLQAGSRVGTVPHLHGMIPSAGSWPREGSQQVLTSLPSSVRWACLSRLPGNPTLYIFWKATYG